MNKTYYKSVRLDGTSHYDRKTLWTPGVEIKVEGAIADGRPCGVGIHGSPTLLDAISCQYECAPSKYLTFTSSSDCLGSDYKKYRFSSVIPGEWLTQQEVNRLAGFNLWESNNPVNPLLVPIHGRISMNEAVLLVSQWASVRASVRASVWASVRASAWDSVGASVGAYIGGLFPSVTTWKYAESLGSDPWRPLLTLWHGGYVPSFDGTTWRLHTGSNAEIVWEGRINAI